MLYKTNYFNLEYDHLPKFYFKVIFFIQFIKQIILRFSIVSQDMLAKMIGILLTDCFIMIEIVLYSNSISYGNRKKNI